MSLGSTFCNSLVRLESPDDLLDILQCRYDDLDLPKLGAAIFERGWLAPSRLRIRPTGTIALGDIGYVTEAGDFVVVENVHHFLLAKSGILSWRVNLMFRSGFEFLEDIPAQDIMNDGRQPYRRRGQVYFTV
jgi:hypothetical protein